MKQKHGFSSILVVIFSIVLLINLPEPNVYAINYESSFHHSHIDSDGAWEITQGTKNITVAVIDSGIDFNHPDLVGTSWNNTDEYPINGVDDDGNGYIDDVSGWDFASNDSTPGPEGGDPITWHGTFCAGLVAAPLNDDGIVGVAPNVTIMDVRILDSAGYGYGNENLGDAIRYAAENGADVISMSLWWSQSELYLDDIQYAVSQNIPVVAITGNDGLNTTAYPGAYPEVIAVGATNFIKEKADYSNYGPLTDIVAPVGDSDGSMIRSAAPPDLYYTGWGTSFACPQVAATIALMRSLNYSLTVDEIKDILFKSATDLGDPGKDGYFGHGLLNVSKAVRAVLDPNELITPTPTRTNFLAIIPAFMVMTITIIVLKKKKIAK